MCHDDERICHKMIVLSDSLKLVAKLFHKRYTLMFADSSLWGIELAYDQVHFSEEGHRVFAGKVTDLIIDVCEGER